MQNNLLNIDCNVAEAVTAGDKLTKRIFDTFFGKSQAKSSIERAKAQSEILKIEALTEIQLEAIRNRSLNRIDGEGIVHQLNIESITKLAIESLNSDAKPEEIDEDWLSYFFSKCRIISDKEMQSLWAKILAGQSNTPKSFSKKTLDLASHLETKDAHLFTKFASFTILMDEPHLKIRNYYPLLINYANKANFFLENGLDFDAITHLEDLGLIKLNLLGGYTYTANVNTVRGTYFKKNLEFTLQRNLNFPESTHQAYHLEVGKALLTRAGNELIKICGAQPNYDFFNWCQQHWSNNNYQFLIVE